MIYRKVKTSSRQDMGELSGSQIDSCINKPHECLPGQHVRCYENVTQKSVSLEKIKVVNI